MATLSKDDLRTALMRLGELAAAEGEHVELLLLGGSVMVLALDERESTRDVDVVIRAPTDRAVVRRLAEKVAQERGWEADWLNEGAKGFLVATTEGSVLIDEPGLRVVAPTVEHMLAMKLCAWRDDLDISDARRLLHEFVGGSPIRVEESGGVPSAGA